MQVILKKDVQNLGEAGDVVNVKDGYARNLLIPQNLAEVATKGALENREKNLERIKVKQEKMHQEALALTEKIQSLVKLELSARAGESGKLFGTVTTKKLAEELSAKLGMDIDKKALTLDKPINKVGDYVMTVKLTSKVKTELPISVSASEILKEEIEEEAVAESEETAE